MLSEEGGYIAAPICARVVPGAVSGARRHAQLFRPPAAEPGPAVVRRDPRCLRLPVAARTTAPPSASPAPTGRTTPSRLTALRLDRCRPAAASSDDGERGRTRTRSARRPRGPKATGDPDRPKTQARSHANERAELKQFLEQSTALAPRLQHRSARPVTTRDDRIGPRRHAEPMRGPVRGNRRRSPAIHARARRARALRRSSRSERRPTSGPRKPASPPSAVRRQPVDRVASGGRDRRHRRSRARRDATRR